MKPPLAALLLVPAVAGSVLTFSMVANPNTRPHRTESGTRLQAPLSAGPSPSLEIGAEALHAGLGISDPAAARVGPVDGSFQTRIDALEAALGAEPQDPSGLRDIAVLLRDAHRDAEAIPYFERLLELDPLDRQTHLDLADSYGRLGRWDEVESLMKDLLSISGNDPAALYNLGAALANRGETEGARVWWRRAVEQTKDPSVARLAESALARIG